MELDFKLRLKKQTHILSGKRKDTTMKALSSYHSKLSLQMKEQSFISLILELVHLCKSPSIDHINIPEKLHLVSSLLSLKWKLHTCPIPQTFSHCKFQNGTLNEIILFRKKIKNTAITCINPIYIMFPHL